MVEKKKLLKIGVACLAAAALVIGLSVGIAGRNNATDQSAASNVKGFGAYDFDKDAQEVCSSSSSKSGKSGGGKSGASSSSSSSDAGDSTRRLVVPTAAGAGGAGRRKLRSELLRELQTDDGFMEVADASAGWGDLFAGVTGQVGGNGGNDCEDLDDASFAACDKREGCVDCIREQYECILDSGAACVSIGSCLESDTCSAKCGELLEEAVACAGTCGSGQFCPTSSSSSKSGKSGGRSGGSSAKCGKSGGSCSSSSSDDVCRKPRDTCSTSSSGKGGKSGGSSGGKSGGGKSGGSSCGKSGGSCSSSSSLDGGFNYCSSSSSSSKSGKSGGGKSGGSSCGKSGGSCSSSGDTSSPTPACIQRPPTICDPTPGPTAGPAECCTEELEFFLVDGMCKRGCDVCVPPVGEGCQASFGMFDCCQELAIAECLEDCAGTGDKNCNRDKCKKEVRADIKACTDSCPGGPEGRPCRRDCRMCPEDTDDQCPQPIPAFDLFPTYVPTDLPTDIVEDALTIAPTPIPTSGSTPTVSDEASSEATLPDRVEGV